MLSKLLIRLFVKHPEDTETEAGRYAYGKLAGSVSLGCNLLLFVIKLTAGLLSGSLAILADGLNNLSDAGSGVMTLIGFRLAHRPADKDHPFGHGRVEYLSTMGVAVLIILAGFELASSAFDKIRNPAPATFTWLTVGILLAAILIKLWLAVFCRMVGKRIHSDTLLATGVDSRNDVLCTSIVLVTGLLSQRFGWMLDGYVGLAVALFVMWSGFAIIRETISPLLGQKPDPTMVENIEKTVMARNEVVGIHDMMIHDYGPGRLIVSLHAEVPLTQDICKSHDVIDCIEQELMEKYHIISCIHMDPVDTNNPETKRLQEMVATQLDAIDPRLALHDFRVVYGDTHTNLLFDVVVPFDYPQREQLPKLLQQHIHQIDPRLLIVIRLETAYT